MDTLARYANPPFNYLGTTLFLSYILLAFYFTFTISLSLYGQYKRLSGLKVAEDVKNARRRHIKIYAFLASIGFALLSYNMLSFLIQSLTTWARTQNLLGRRLSLLDLRFWMLETNLFGTFAQELVQKRPSAFWTQAALLATWFWNVWMAFKGLSPDAHLKETQEKSPTTKAAPKTETPQPQAKKTSLVIPTILFNAALLALSSLRSHSIFMPLVLFTRLLLLVPHTGRLRFSQNDILQSVSISFGFLVANLTMSRGTTTFREVVAGLSNGGFATKTLGYDAELGLLICAILGWGGGV
ncbi:uncharacterized protein N0V89_008132 [Didymosphaeria variabile]|uniref:Uncharacterized protein n=1 Tax=Didymosphaeria variabile TaxID=1932322 RepID=A0A9W8XHI4_9PLEO|nr:uncharacterized protein N0V89_008132 [Didymosphaeria variabile]KAJ4349516.1 hypothetical protein N0V89_008132 [Didymosphaeria variabile]